MGTTEDKVAELEELRQPPLSLDAPSGGETRRLSEAIADASADPAAVLTRLFRERADLVAVLDDLAPNERTVLRRRFGLEGDEPETLETIGQRLQLSRERVRQIESAGRRIGGRDPRRALPDLDRSPRPLRHHHAPLAGRLRQHPACGGFGGGCFWHHERQKRRATIDVSTEHGLIWTVAIIVHETC